ncbi:bifunctional UDP-N-acetylglucosamine diphosphorylase/glucosamine-1-phosphate N-acetyltransferase GlmU [Solicola sp. PLA-1-18]|uniref:bifunctional UDP-N-acetylglucosamine diphosphorylase/glucosamine-1-phosphate N-acetyltransferase GlmU n=1 Tax=Solicola sp. PLA-1-18 TaxID=3380532 RepID=UPI003B7CC7D8
MPDALSVIVLAAGGGTRMRSRTSKLLHAVGGRSLVGHALSAVQAVGPDHVAVVVGHAREQVEPHVRELAPEAVTGVQHEQLGTGHAVQVGVDALGPAALAAGTTVLVTYGDVPLLSPETLRALVDDHAAAGRAVSVLTADLPDPTGYGRIVRGPGGDVERIVEQRDATPEEQALREVNSGIYALDGAFLVDALGRIGNDNAQREYYLTDVVAIARADGLAVGAHRTDDAWQTEGVNDRSQLAAVGAELNRRILRTWMREGVTVVDPGSTWVDVTVVLEPDVTLLPGTQLHGATEVASGAVLGPDTTLTDVVVGADATVVRTHGSGAVLGAGATVGPFAYLRPGTELGVGGKIGTYVETKNARIGDGAKVPHLSYVGDADVGEGSNIGAGTIVANYDGVDKHRTTVGRHCRTGSDNIFVAPVTIGDGAFTGAGTTVREDVPPGALAVSSGPQRIIEGWVARRRPGSASDEAARAASPTTTEETSQP